MVDWTTVLIGVGTSLIATGLSGVCKFVFSYTKRKWAEAQLKRDSSSPRKSQTKDSYFPGSYSVATYIRPANNYDIDILALTHPDNDHLQGLILAPHHGSRTFKKNL
jgi:beta-lactamase superfamily II metal-dependent hydrolase